MPDTVRMTHPNLPGRVITVLPMQVRVKAKSGWQPEQPEPALVTPADSEPPAPDAPQEG